MKNILNKIFLVILGASTMLSCTQEMGVQPDKILPGEGSSIQIVTRAALFTDEPDDKISSLRIIAFDKNPTQNKVLNAYYPETDLSATISFTMVSGTYDFVLIANEPASGAIHDALEGITRWDNLANISFPASLFEVDRNIPMMLNQPDVTILTDNGGLQIEGVTASTWEPALRRMAAKFDIVLKSTTDLDSNFGGITFYNLPDNVPLMGNYSGSHTTSRTYSVSVNPQYFENTTVAGYAWAKKIKRIIIPSNNFDPHNDLDRAIGFTVEMNKGANPGCIFGIDQDNSYYTIPFNTHFKVDATVSFPLKVNVDIADWGQTNVNGNTTDRKLNVSATTVSITDRSQMRVYFYSNQPSVSVETTGYSGTTGSSTFTVNNIFQGLAGASAANFSYDPATGQGYMDISYNMATGSLLANTQYAHRIYLNAGGLKREITVNTRTTGSPPSIDWVGTFHRWNQTGERIIYSNHTGGAWSVSVVQGNFVVLSTSRSLDPKLGTDEWDDPEKYQVTDGSTSVSGTGKIYFRVGLTGKLASATATPRYALLKLTYSNNAQTAYIYVRQGEAADVVGTAKWTVFNLSDPSRGAGGSNFTDHSLFTPRASAATAGIFADYPTQVGYMFLWNLYNGTAGNNRAIHPTNPTGDITGYPIGHNPATWNDNYDPCPAGYRHPSSAETAALIPNTLYGYYADGFFDRGVMTTVNVMTVRGKLGHQFSTVGRLFYEPSTNASIFLPIAGNRISGGNLLSGFQADGCYTTSEASGNAISLHFNGSSTITNSTSFSKARAYSVRCVLK